MGETTMSYKNLLVHVDDSKGSAGRIDVAVRLALDYGAHLTGIYLISEPSPAGFVQGYLPPELIGTLQAEARGRAEAALARFTEAAERNQLSHEARTEQVLPTEAAEALCMHARYADLLILGQVDPDDETADWPRLPEEVVLGSGRPGLVVPYIGAPKTLGTRVVIAWDAGRESARAVADAVPLLERARSVYVVSINPRSDAFGHGDEPGADIALHLARHDIKVEVQRIESRDIDVANTILSHIADQAADLLVMGAYGHSRLRELVLGGVTRTILRDMTVPVLMSH
jgi:nucleotide-binding universal stress UspA family protein